MSRLKTEAQRRTPTIADVAAQAGVSLATVSRVMNGNPKVDETLAVRVRDAALALGYTASPLARGLVLGKTQTIAVVVPDLGNPTFQGALRGISDHASREGYRVLVADSHEHADDERDLAIEARRRCDGVVLCAPRMPAEQLAAVLPLLDPVVVVNRVPGGAEVPSVVADYGSGLSQILEHLYGLGHRRMAYLAGNSNAASNTSRLAAIRDFGDAHEDARIDVTPCGVEFEDGHAAGDAIANGPATAAVAFNDLVAMGLISSLTELGVRVPQDISVTGFDDIPFARYTTPPLTTAAVPVEELGGQAWERMWALLNGRTPASDHSFEPKVVRRASTGPVRGA